MSKPLFEDAEARRQAVVLMAAAIMHAQVPRLMGLIGMSSTDVSTTVHQSFAVAEEFVRQAESL